MQNIVTLGEINDALKIAAVSAAQLADMGFAALANKPICEGLPPEESRRLRNAKLYPAESIGQIRVALAQRLAAPATMQASVSNATCQAAPAAVAVSDDRWRPDVCPITGRKFFMWVTHHDTGVDVPTYGGPFDSYTIPVKDKDGSYSCERYDHDLGGWREWEDVGLTIVDDQSFVVDPDNSRYDEIRDFAEGRAALAATPANGDSLEQLNENKGLVVVLPEPVAWIANYEDREGNSKYYTSTHKDLAQENDTNGEPQSLFTEQQVRALLAGVAAPAAVGASLWTPISKATPEWTDDDAVRVIALTADHDFGGVQVHDIKASDFYLDDGGGVVGTEVTEVCTHWAYRDALMSAAPAAPQAQADARDALTPAARDVLAERQRQISAEGRSSEHDDEYLGEELALGAAWYATPTFTRNTLDANDMSLWPLSLADSWFKPGDRRRELTKAGALVLAEIERIDRAAIAAAKGE